MSASKMFKTFSFLKLIRPNFGLLINKNNFKTKNAARVTQKTGVLIVFMNYSNKFCWEQNNKNKKTVTTKDQK